MKFSGPSVRLFHRLHLPGALLLALLQRTPVVRVVANASDFVLRAPASFLLKSAVSILGSLGAMHSLAGATTLGPSTPSPTSATVGTTKTIVFDVLGAQSNAGSWTVGGSVPPGLSFNGGKTSGIVNTPTGLLTLTGTPTTAGTYVISLKAWENSNGGGAQSPNYSYTVNVSGGAVATAPSFTTQPAAQTVTAGANVTFAIAATGSPTPTLQWQKNGSGIAGQTGTSLTLNAVTAADAGSYTCVATNSAGSATSNAASLTVNAATVAPGFSTQPATQSVTAGGSVTFTVTATGSPTPTLQWQKNGSPIAGQTGTSLTLNAVTSADAGSYTCVATNSAGSATSNAASLTVNAATVAPGFSTQPATQSATAGGSVTFTVTATGSPTPTLQWQKNGSPIAGQTGTSLTLNAVTSADAGSYTCVATNSAGSATSNTASLTVNAATVAPGFSTQPATQSATAGGSVTFTVTATGSPTPTLQWQKNGSPIAGQTGTSLTLNAVTSADAGSYTCVATNSAGSATSNAANLTVNTATVAPGFSTQPATQSVTAGGSITFTVIATGSPTPTLQWQKNGSPIAGQTGSSLTLTAVTAADAGSYTCVATNSMGSATSNAASLTITAAAIAPGFSTHPATQSVTAGASATFTVIATGSPTPTLQWQKNGAAIAGQTSASLTINNVTAADTGSYTCVGTNSAGSATSNAATLTVNTTPAAPAFSIQPASQTVPTGTNITLTVAVTGFPAPTLQWLKDGAVLAGQNGSTLVLNNIQPANAGSYTCVATNTVGSATSNVATVVVTAATEPASRISNVSVRSTLATGQTLIVGFTMQGGAKPVLVRAVGPSLSTFGVVGAMRDPRLMLYKEANMLTQNDDWGGNASLRTAFASVGAFPLTPSSLDAALMRTVDGGYTAQVRGTSGGNVLVEAYDAGTGALPRLSNISARNFAGTGGNILIAGFTIAGKRPINLLIRAIGPALGAFGVPGFLGDPRLTVYNTAGVAVAENDNWDANLTVVFTSVGAFALPPGSNDAALTISLPPGGYTVHVSGADGGTGEALVELYELP